LLAGVKLRFGPGISFVLPPFPVFKGFPLRLFDTVEQWRIGDESMVAVTLSPLDFVIQPAQTGTNVHEK